MNIKTLLSGAMLFFIMNLFGGCSISAPRYVHSEENLSSLEKTEVRIVDGKRFFSNAWMEKRGDIYMLHLKGSAYERGYQHGKLLRDEIRLGVVNQYADVVARGQGGFSIRNWLLEKYVDYRVFRPLEKAQPKDLLAELKGISDGCGIPYKTIFKANNDTAATMTLLPVK